MGVGLILIVSPQDAARTLALLEGAGEAPSVVGEVKEGAGVVIC
jgi:phosphoribosylaminoimidazole (AIR) synthetase